jgi:CBS domain-containing protein
MKVEKIIADKEIVYSIQPHKRISDAAKLMNEKRIGALMVLDENQNIEGIVTERDILHECAVAEDDFQYTLVKEIMTPKEKLIFGSKDDDLRDLMGFMTKNNIRHIPIMDNEKLIALVSIRDVVQVIFEMMLLRQY